VTAIVRVFGELGVYGGDAGIVPLVCRRLKVSTLPLFRRKNPGVPAKGLTARSTSEKQL
jgi:hypothetical protein